MANTKLKTFKKRLHKLFLSPKVSALVLALFFEIIISKGKYISILFENTSKSIISLTLTYLLSYAIASLIYKKLTTTEFHTETELKNRIEKVVDNASEYIYIVSPYLNAGNVLLESIIRASLRGVKVTLIHHKDQLSKPQSTTAFIRLLNAGVKVLHHPNLHAKLYISDKDVVIASLNLIESSYSNSFEAGIYSNLKELRKDVLDYIKDTIVKSDLCTETTKENTPPEKGFCIRTKVKIPYNPNRPIEINEYNNSNRNPNGKYCHMCGVEEKTSVSNPFCKEHTI